MARIPSAHYAGYLADGPAGAYALGNGYRVYLPWLMRFAAPDSWSPFGPAGVHPYAYCGDQPVSRADPGGHMDLAFDITFDTAALADRANGRRPRGVLPVLQEETEEDLAREEFGEAPPPARDTGPGLRSSRDFDREAGRIDRFSVLRRASRRRGTRPTLPLNAPDDAAAAAHETIPGQSAAWQEGNPSASAADGGPPPNAPVPDQALSVHQAQRRGPGNPGPRHSRARNIASAIGGSQASIAKVLDDPPPGYGDYVAADISMQENRQRFPYGGYAPLPYPGLPSPQGDDMPAGQ
ncbi:RHS repeat-associated core domain-containing protein [Bordetella bronchialis]|uniref:RHS repeat-associated core domain-containing protein n=1 Tax=Bordetella bronchialis TaxID=463025 RepID=A0ABN4R418_9BORD|nr:RHS repeat-associated core domain-containing protein [Bordetella bronchialis]ANN67374.1 hypothetical protein BAU06_14660 [Bordetella bronchialis]